MFPAAQTKSKFDKNFAEKGLPEEYKDFMAKWDANVLVSFGTTFMPPVDTMKKIVEMTQLPEMKKL